ncbi:hypothetical protein F511_26004 [Dorcoceras hygrometricum]|uniref:Uncharacterized protein n=1 Tax=Dorcoceras hygrometricum TaxID=472368 RepID=A0A2Z7DG45_9LAMI|nr:hypothetical protein F511_26004 [Dorcoceras hygrometricum]
MRRRLSKWVRRRFENQSLVCFVMVLAIVGESAVGSCVCWFGFCWCRLVSPMLFIGRLGLQIRYQIPYLEYFQPFVPYLSNPRTLFSREFSGDFPSFPVVVLLVRGRAAIPHSHLPARIVATMRRVVNYHSSWARQQQVEWFDASGNPGSTAGRGFNPAGGAPGDCGRYRQSGPRPEPRLLCQPALEALTNSALMDSPRRIGRNEFRQLEAVAAATLGGGGGGL